MMLRVSQGISSPCESCSLSCGAALKGFQIRKSPVTLSLLVEHSGCRLVDRRRKKIKPKAERPIKRLSHSCWQNMTRAKSYVAVWWRDVSFTTSEKGKGTKNPQRLGTPTYFLYNVLHVIFYFSEQYCAHCFKLINSQDIILLHPSIIL